MTINLFSRLLAIAMCFSIYACEKGKEDASEKDKATEDSRFSCKVNGQDWKADPPSKLVKYDWVKMRPSVEARQIGSYFYLRAIKSLPNDTSLVDIATPLSMVRTSTYILTGAAPDSYGIFMKNADMSTVMMSYNDTCWLTITKYDEIGKKTSGNFRIHLKRKYSPYDEIKITEGKFEDIDLEL